MQILTTGLALLVITSLAMTQELSNRSEFTDFGICEERDPGDMAPFLEVCTGHAGYEIWNPYSEHGGALAFGPNGIEAQLDIQPPAGGLFLEIGPVIDWRYEAGATRPFANIIRWKGITPVYDEGTAEFTGETRIEANILVVSALRDSGPVSACHIAWIDAQEIANANQIAHEWADRYAADFTCGVDEVVEVTAEILD